MACTLNTGWSLGCRDNTGGIKRVLICAFTSNRTYTYNGTGLVLTGDSTSADATQTFYEFEQTSEVAEFTQEGAHSIENGTNFWNQNVNLVFHKYQASVRDLVFVLAQKEVTIIIEDQNNKYFLIGEVNGANLVKSTGNAGKAYGDMNGSTISFLAKEPTLARECDAAYIASITIV